MRTILAAMLFALAACGGGEPACPTVACPGATSIEYGIVEGARCPDVMCRWSCAGRDAAPVTEAFEIYQWHDSRYVLAASWADPSVCAAP